MVPYDETNSSMPKMLLLNSKIIITKNWNKYTYIYTYMLTKYIKMYSIYDFLTVFSILIKIKKFIQIIL